MQAMEATWPWTVSSNAMPLSLTTLGEAVPSVLLLVSIRVVVVVLSSADNAQKSKTQYPWRA
jgi:hypothetical protein